jgi:hypothetical protein
MGRTGANLDLTRKGEDGQRARIHGADVEKNEQRAVVPFAPIAVVAAASEEIGHL